VIVKFINLIAPFAQAEEYQGEDAPPDTLQPQM